MEPTYENRLKILDAHLAALKREQEEPCFWARQLDHLIEQIHEENEEDRAKVRARVIVLARELGIGQELV